MSEPTFVTLTLDRRLLEHPRAYHLRRMRAGIWLYLDLLARLPAKAGTLEVEPAAVGQAMGLPEGTVRSWLGHLRKAGYVEVERLNGKLRLGVKHVALPTPPVEPATPKKRFFTVAKLQRVLGEPGNDAVLQAALDIYPDPAVRRAIAGALRPPREEIRRSRTALFLFLVKKYAEES